MKVTLRRETHPEEIEPGVLINQNWWVVRNQHGIAQEWHAAGWGQAWEYTLHHALYLALHPHHAYREPVWRHDGGHIA